MFQDHRNLYHSTLGFVVTLNSRVESNVEVGTVLLPGTNPRYCARGIEFRLNLHCCWKPDSIYRAISKSIYGALRFISVRVYSFGSGFVLKPLPC